VPKLACIVLAHGRSPGLREAVASLEAQKPAVELVVSHSGPDAPRLGHVRVLHSDARLFPGAARNRGVDATAAPFVAFLACDCVAQPGWAEARLREHEAGAAAVADVLVTPDGPAAALAAWLLQHRRRSPLAPGARPPYGLSYERSWLERLGGFREDLRTGEDSELNRRLLAAGAAVAYPPDVRCAHAYHGSLSALLRDQRARGTRRAAAEAAIGGPGAGEVALQAMGGAGRALRVAARLPDRAAAARAAPLVVMGAAAHALGALRPTSRDRAAAERSADLSRR
jgi:GT2 family glycosyltransferase